MDPNEHNSGESEEEEVAPQVKSRFDSFKIVFSKTEKKLQDSIEDIKSSQSQLADGIDKVNVNADEVLEDQNEQEVADENEVEDENEIDNDDENEAEEGEGSPGSADVTQVKAPQGEYFHSLFEKMLFFRKIDSITPGANQEND